MHRRLWRCARARRTLTSICPGKNDRQTFDFLGTQMMELHFYLCHLHIGEQLNATMNHVYSLYNRISRVLTDSRSNPFWTKLCLILCCRESENKNLEFAIYRVRAYFGHDKKKITCITFHTRVLSRGSHCWGFRFPLWSIETEVNESKGHKVSTYVWQRHQPETATITRDHSLLRLPISDTSLSPARTGKPTDYPCIWQTDISQNKSFVTATVAHY